MSDLESTLKENLSKGEVTFTFKKQNGELREMRGTTSLDLIPVEAHPTPGGTPKRGSTPVYDLDAQGWRSFSNGSVAEIK